MRRKRYENAVGDNSVDENALGVREERTGGYRLNQKCTQLCLGVLNKVVGRGATLSEARA